MNIKFTFKGAMTLVLGVFAINFITPFVTSLLGVEANTGVVVANTFLSAAVVTFTITKIDGTYQGPRHTIRLYAFIAFLFFVISSLWVSGIIV